jgi:hypothetical protein
MIRASSEASMPNPTNDATLQTAYDDAVILVDRLNRRLERAQAEKARLWAQLSGVAPATRTRVIGADGTPSGSRVVTADEMMLVWKVSKDAAWQRLQKYPKSGRGQYCVPEEIVTGAA